MKRGADDLQPAEVADERRLALALRRAVVEEAHGGVPERVHHRVGPAHLLLFLGSLLLRSLLHRAAPQNLLGVFHGFRDERHDAVG